MNDAKPDRVKKELFPVTVGLIIHSHGQKTEMADSTIAPPPQPAISMAARREEGCHEKHTFTHIVACKGLSNKGVGMARGAIIEEIRPGAGFETCDFVQEKLDGLPWNDSNVTRERKRKMKFRQVKPPTIQSPSSPT